MIKVSFACRMCKKDSYTFVREKGAKESEKDFLKEIGEEISVSHSMHSPGCKGKPEFTGRSVGKRDVQDASKPILKKLKKE